MGTEKVAPPPLDVVQRFVNTVNLERARDDVADPEGLRAWLLGEGLISEGVTVSATDVVRARTVREGFRQLMVANNGQEPEAAAIARLNSAAQGLTLRPAFAVGGVALQAAAVGVDAALAKLCGIVSESVAAGTWPRMKACRKHSCEWAFYDHSRNASATWCTMAICGNRVKASTYRSRRGSEGS